MSDADDRAFFQRRFPTARARNAADEAVDRLPPAATMQEHIDEWFRVYRATGGREPWYKD